MSSKIKWNFLLFAYSSLFIMGLIDNSRGPLYPDILHSLHITPAQGSAIFTLASLSGLLINITGRYWLPLIGASKGIIYSLLLMGIGTLLMGIAPVISFPLHLLYIASFLLGIGLSGSGICMNILVSLAVNEELKQRAFAALHATYGIASFMAPGLIYLSTLVHFSWYEYFISLSIVPFLTAFIFLFQLPSTSNTSEDEHNMTPPLNFWQRLPYAIIFGSYVASEIIISSRLVLYLQRVHSFSEQHSGQALSIFFALLTLGRLLFATIKIERLNASQLLTLSLLSSIVIFILGKTISPWIFALSGLSMSFFFPVGINWLTTLFKQQANFMIATVMTSIGVALIISHYIFGILATTYSLPVAFLLIPLCSVLSLLTLRYQQTHVTP